MIANSNYSYRRIAVAFIFVIAIMTAITSLGLYQIQRVSKQLDYVVDVHNVENEIIHGMLKAARERSLAIQTMLLRRDPFAWDEQARYIANRAAKYIELRERLLSFKLSDELQGIHKKQHLTTIKTGALQTRVINLIRDEEYEQAHALLYDEAIPSQNRAMKLMEAFIDQLRIDTSRRVEDSKLLIDTSITNILVLLITGILVGIIIAVGVTRRLNHEIGRRNQIETELEQRVEDRTQELAYLASHDALTTLPNRSVFSAQLATSIKHSARNKTMVALFFMDLDGFKGVNDRYGHAVGDSVLIEVCSRFKDAIRDEDVVARLGGDEFTLILSGLDKKDDAFIVANKIIEVINLPMRCGQHECQVGISIGISFFPENGTNADALLTQADNAMYVAKRAGKNRYATA